MYTFSSSSVVRIVCGSLRIRGVVSGCVGRQPCYSTAREADDAPAIPLPPFHAPEQASQYLEPDMHRIPTEDFSNMLSSSLHVHYFGQKYLLYNSVINNKIGSFSNVQKNILFRRIQKKYIQLQAEDDFPLILKKQTPSSLCYAPNVPVLGKTVNQQNFPLSQYMDIEHIKESNVTEESEDPEVDTRADIKYRMEEFKEGAITPVSLKVMPETHMGTEVRRAKSMERVIRTLSNSSYTRPSEEEEEFWQQLGTSDRSIPQTSVPCGGCGALFHCHDPSIPGYKPREMIVGVPKHLLRSSVCARCFFLTIHNTALQVRVSPESYIDILRPIKSKKCLVLVMVDLTDAPCSINPNIVEVIDSGQPVIVVGSKVDLLPMDLDGCLDRLSEAFLTMIRASPLAAARVVDTCLVSAKTGFGVESLVSSVMQHWGTRGDIYLVGSVNAGKSTLFNALLQSDLCVALAANMLLRATASPWPGTTLNMLKFPVQRCSGKLRFLRKLRLDEQLLQLQQKHTAGISSRGVPTPSFSPLSVLTGQVGRTYAKNTLPLEAGMRDVFKESSSMPMVVPEVRGINEEKDHYRLKKWFYDTPGVVQPDQFLSLLTHEELQLVLPRATIIPETFRVKAGVSILLGGVARLDVLYVYHPVPGSRRLMPSDFVFATVFRSAELPVTVMHTVEVSSFYRNNLGNDLLGVPQGGGNRLLHWPVLKPADTMRVTGVPNLIPLSQHRQLMASADLVLSSAGWISLAVSPLSVCEVRVWTPGGRGAYLRSPAFLPYAPLLRGSRIKGCVNYLSPAQHQLEDSEPSDCSDIYRMSPMNYAKYMGFAEK